MSRARKIVKLHIEAKTELLDSVVFYRERAGEKWANLFKERVAEGLVAIASDPERHPKFRGFPDVQKIQLKQFPFSLLYINRTDIVWVVAVAHGSRKPGFWKDRLSA